MMLRMTTTASPSGGSAPATVLTPTRGVDPRAALATSMYAAPGVYAFLVGSGVSSAAGVPTGFRIVEDLVRQIARQTEIDPTVYEKDPSGWWTAQTGRAPRYDDLVLELAPTERARQSLLRQYFEVNDSGGPIVPTSAHASLAQLCAGGYVRVVLTTNFDNLLEQALDAAHVTFNVLATEHQIRAREPLAHAPVSVIKLHGDYRSTRLRNAPDELAAYGPEQTALLRQVLDEYGLVTIGWSGAWDLALIDAIRATLPRRYPLYWVSHGSSVNPAAARLIAERHAVPVLSTGADEILSDLVQRVERLAVRARRRDTPTLRRSYVHQPPDSPAHGWTAVPWLILRTVASTTQVDADTTGLIDPEVRARILLTLRTQAFRGQLAAWNSRDSLDACPPHVGSDGVTQPPDSTSAPAPSALSDWIPVPGLQSASHATYRLGGDGRVGVSAVAEIRMPSNGVGDVLFILDIGISLEAALPVVEISQVLRDGLVLVASDLPAAMADVLPTDATLTRAEVYLLAPNSDGKGGSRANSVTQRVDLHAFQIGPADHSQIAQYSLGFAADVTDGLTSVSAGELIASGWNYLALTLGFLDPRPGIAQIRGALGLMS